MARLAARHTILDVIGCLLTNCCQIEKLLFYGLVFSRFSKLPIFGRFVPQIIGPIHVHPVSTDEDTAGHSTTGLAPLIAIRKPRPPDYLHAAVRQESIPLFSRSGSDRENALPSQAEGANFSTMLGVQPCQPEVLELSGISLVSL
jgi:hypothetical protein